MRVVICDSDQACAQRCALQLEELAAVHAIEVIVDIVESGKRLLFEEEIFAQVDVIYLDQNMPSVTGLETAHALRDRGVQADIVFYTSDESHVFEGYDVEALHYLIKDSLDGMKRFEQVFLKASERCAKRRSQVISLMRAGEYRNIDIKDIVYFEVKKRIITVYYYRQKELLTFEFYSPLSKIEERLYGQGFLRLHRAYLVNGAHVRRRNKQEVEMDTGVFLPVGGVFASRTTTETAV